MSTGQQDRRGLRVIRGEKDLVPVEGRVPPHDLDAEAAVLSAAILDANALDQVLEILKPEHFYSDSNRRIFEAALTLTLEGTPLDSVTIAAWLRSREWLNQVGGSAYVAQVIDATPSIRNVVAHAKIVYEKWRLRALIAKCWTILAEAYGDVGTTQAFIEMAIASLEELVHTSATGSQLATIAQAVDEAYATLGLVQARAGQVLGYSTGLRGLDACLGGLAPSDVTLLSAKMKMPDGRWETTSAGKSALVVSMAMHIAQNPYRTTAEKDGQRVVTDTRIGILFFCLEMTRKQMAMRMACQVAQVSWSDLRTGKFTDPETGALRYDINVAISEAMKVVRRLPIRFFTDKGLKPSGVRAKVLAARAAFAAEDTQLGVVVIDSIGWMKPERESRDNNPERELNEIGRDLRDLSRDERIDGIHYIVVTQIQENGKPKNCTSLADHAVNVATLETVNVVGASELEGTIHVRKTREGEREERVPVRYLKRFGVFVDG